MFCVSFSHYPCDRILGPALSGVLPPFYRAVCPILYLRLSTTFVVCLRFFRTLIFSSPSQAVFSCFSASLVHFGWFSSLSHMFLFLNSLTFSGLFPAVCSSHPRPTFLSLSTRLFLVLRLCLFANSAVSFERFAPFFSNCLICFQRFAYAALVPFDQ